MTEKETAMTKTCRKKCFSTEWAAERTAVIIFRRNRRELDVYYCDTCGCWHLTTRKKIDYDAPIKVRKMNMF